VTILRWDSNHSFKEKRVNQVRMILLDELNAARNTDQRKIAWKSAEEFVKALYQDEPCLFKVAKLILNYSASQAGLLNQDH
jgi:uncharacterized protein YqfB (UPF0267 family)